MILESFLRSLPSFSSTLYQPAPWLSEALGAIPSESGVTVSERTAITISSVWTCVNIISTAIASLPCEVCQDNDEGVHEPLYNSPLYRLLHDSPNGEDTSYTFRQKMMAALLLYGNAYAEIQYDTVGRIVALWPWPTSMVKIEIGENRGDLWYWIHDRRVPKQDMLHLRGFCYEGIVGLSPIQNLKRMLGLNVATEIFASHFYKNGARANGILMYPGKLGDKGKSNLAESFARHNEGLANAHKTIVLEEGAQYQQLTVSQNDAQFLETQKLSRAAIAGVFNVPAMLVPGADEKATTYASAEQMMRVFVDFCLRGWMVLWEQGIKEKVLGPNQYIRFDTTEFMKADAEARAKYYQSLWQTGSINSKQIALREGLDLPTEGARYYIPANNYSPVDKIDQVIDAKTAPPTPPSPATPPALPDNNSPEPGKGAQRTISNGIKGLLAHEIQEIQKWQFFSEKRAAAKLKPIIRAAVEDIGEVSDDVLDNWSAQLAGKIKEIRDVPAEVNALVSTIDGSAHEPSEIVSPVSRAPEIHIHDHRTEVHNVYVPEQRQQPTPIVNVTTPEVRVDVAPPTVNIEPTVVNVAAPEPSIVNVTTPEVRVDVAAPNVTVPQPIVNVTTPEVKVDVASPAVKVEAPVVNLAPNITVEAKLQAPPKVSTKRTQTGGRKQDGTMWSEIEERVIEDDKPGSKYTQ